MENGYFQQDCSYITEKSPDLLGPGTAQHRACSDPGLSGPDLVPPSITRNTITAQKPGHYQERPMFPSNSVITYLVHKD